MIMDVGDATSATSMDVVKVDLENQVGLKLGVKNAKWTWRFWELPYIQASRAAIA